MKYRIVIKDEVLADVENFLDYIAEEQEQPEIAVLWWEKALDTIETLERMPRRCPIAPENVWSKNELRMLIIDRCLFIFHVDDEMQAVQIIKFRHGSQQAKPIDEKTP